jgi:hypothetical protein
LSRKHHKLRIASAWTLDAQREHFKSLIANIETRIYERDKSHREMVRLALDAAKDANAKAEQALEKRLEGLNEFRGTLADQQAKLMTREAAELAIQSIHAEAVADKKEVTVRMDGFREQLELLSKQDNRQRGKSEGFKIAWALVVVLVMMAIGILGLVFHRI